MKKAKTAAKIIAGTTVAGTAAYIGLGGLLCYGILSKKICNKHPEELLHIPANMKRYLSDENFRTADDWYTAINPDDTVLINEKGEKLIAKIIPNEAFSHKWLIAVHGYTSRPRAVARQAIHFYKNGYNVIMPLQRAHRNRDEKFTSMGYYEKYDVISWINYILSSDPDAEIVLLGISMGSATVMMTTGEELPSNVKCCIADCGYSNCFDLFQDTLDGQTSIPPSLLLNMANSFSSIFLGWNFKDCSPIDAVAHSKTPTLFIHGDKDSVVPFWMMEALFEKCSAKKEKLAVPKAGHDEACEKQPEMYWEAVDGFIKNFI
ncbi:MAG: alpha/beta hydrolase [Clostridia bacterium]|nr:alpha/beta hydrolase [Clostridia bacterium]